MTKRLILVTTTVLVWTAAWTQLRIISFNSNGVITWTNSFYRGFYNVESSAAPTGPWTTMATVADLDWAKTNRITFQAPPTNAHGTHRVEWLPPDPIGVWDYLCL